MQALDLAGSPYFALVPAAGQPAADAPSSKAAIEQALAEDLVPTYKPTLPIHAWTLGDAGLPPLWRFYFDLPGMLPHPVIDNGLDYFKSGVAGAEIESIEASSPAVARFAEKEFRNFWGRCLPAVQHGYDWGWVGLQTRYTIEQGLLSLSGLDDFAPQDATPLVGEKSRYVGFRLRNVDGGSFDLWGPSARSPAKGFWYAHRARYGQLHGRSQVYPAYQPWRRLAAHDGADETIDHAFYRFAFRGPIVRHPEGNEGPSTVKRPSPERPNYQAVAREMGEGVKHGASIALPNTRDGKGEYAWMFEWPDHVLDVQVLLAYPTHLHDLITLGCGTPPELIKAAETGSGYSGREIPLEGFFCKQQVIANDILRQWMEQILLPLIWWNFGPQAWCKITLKSLLKSRVEAARAANPQAPPGSTPNAGDGHDRGNPNDGQPGGAGDATSGGAGGQPSQSHNRFGPMHKPLMLATAGPRDEPVRAPGAGALLGDTWYPGGATIRRDDWDAAPERDRRAVLRRVRRNGWRMMAAHAPAGGITINGKKFTGGEFIPDEDLAHATPEEKAKLTGRHGAKSSLTADDAHSEYEAIRKELGSLSFDELRSRFDRIASTPKAVLVDLAKRLGFTTDGSREQLAKRLLGNLEGLKTSKGQVERIGRSDAPLQPGIRFPLAPPGHQLATTAPTVAKSETLETPAEAIAREAAAALAALSAAARRELFDVLAGDGTEGERLDQAREVLARYRVTFARQLGYARLAALLDGMREAAKDVPLSVAIESPALAIDANLQATVDFLRPMPADTRADVLAQLKPDVRPAIEQALAVDSGAAGPPWRPTAVEGEGTGDEPPAPLLKLIDEAVADLRRRVAFTRDDFDALDRQSRDEAFTVAGIESENAIVKVQDALADVAAEGPTLEAFKGKVEESVGEGTFLSEGHAETVYRTNLQTAYSNGQATVLAHPMVADLFPYRVIYPIHDDRVRPWHLALEKSGIQGTAVYRADDPTWDVIRPPSDYACRCGWSGFTIEQAAAAGVDEAKAWLRSGTPPASRAWVSLPAGWRQSPSFVRMSTDSPHAPAGGITAGGKTFEGGQFIPTTGSLEDIPVGELHTVSGFKVRRTGEESYRIEKQGGRGHVSGDAATVRAHIDRETSHQRAYGRQLREALKRAADYAEPSFMESDRLDEAARAFSKLPKGIAVVSLEDETFGRTGRIVKDETGASRVKLDGEDGYSGNHVEPLDPKHSWRAPRKEKAKEPEQRMLFATDSGGGRWITIGGRKDEKGKRQGGSPVYVKDGRIIKGHPSLTGKKIGSMKDEDEAVVESSRRGEHQKELNQSKGYERAKFAKTARQEGIEPKHLHQLAAEILEHDRVFTADKQQITRDARDALKEFGGHGKVVALLARHGKDAESIPGLDEVAEDLAKRHPSYFPENEHASDVLFAMLSAAGPERMSEADAYEHALEHLRNEQKQPKYVPSDEPIGLATVPPEPAEPTHITVNVAPPVVNVTLPPPPEVNVENKIEVPPAAVNIDVSPTPITVENKIETPAPLPPPPPASKPDAEFDVIVERGSDGNATRYRRVPRGGR